jgi:hypothetical protein
MRQKTFIYLGKFLFVYDIYAGRKNRYTVYIIPEDSASNKKNIRNFKIIGREVPFDKYMKDKCQKILNEKYFHVRNAS